MFQRFSNYSHPYVACPERVQVSETAMRDAAGLGLGCYNVYLHSTTLTISYRIIVLKNFRYFLDFLFDQIFHFWWGNDFYIRTVAQGFLGEFTEISH